MSNPLTNYFSFIIHLVDWTRREEKTLEKVARTARLDPVQLISISSCRFLLLICFETTANEMEAGHKDRDEMAFNQFTRSMFLLGSLLMAGELLNAY